MSFTKDPADIDPLDPRVKTVATILLDCMGPRGAALGVFETARHLIAWHENQTAALASTAKQQSDLLAGFSACCECHSAGQNQCGMCKKAQKLRTQ